MPLPIETELRVQLSPVPTHTTLESDGSSAIAPMDCTGCLSNTGLNVVPPSSDFHTPPEAAPTNTVTLPSFSCRAATAEMRPLITAEPMLRAPRPDTAAESRPAAAATRGGENNDAATTAASACVLTLHSPWSLAQQPERRTPHRSAARLPRPSRTDCALFRSQNCLWRRTLRTSAP